MTSFIVICLLYYKRHIQIFAQIMVYSPWFDWYERLWWNHLVGCKWEQRLCFDFLTIVSSAGAPSLLQRAECSPGIGECDQWPVPTCYPEHCHDQSPHILKTGSDKSWLHCCCCVINNQWDASQSDRLQSTEWRGRSMTLQMLTQCVTSLSLSWYSTLIFVYLFRPRLDSPLGARPGMIIIIIIIIIILLIIITGMRRGTSGCGSWRRSRKRTRRAGPWPTTTAGSTAATAGPTPWYSTRLPATAITTTATFIQHQVREWCLYSYSLHSCGVSARDRILQNVKRVWKLFWNLMSNHNLTSSEHICQWEISLKMFIFNILCNYWDFPDFSSACPGQAGDLRLTRRQAKANAWNIFSNNQTYVRSGFLTGNSMGLFSSKA